MLAVAIADILVRDLDPGVALGLGDHALDEAAVLLFDVRTAPQLGPCLADADEERVPNSLELGRAENAGATHRADLPFDAPARERRGPKFGELLLEAGDLAAKLVADGPVVGGDQVLQRYACPGASGGCL